MYLPFSLISFLNTFLKGTLTTLRTLSESLLIKHAQPSATRVSLLKNVPV